MQKLISRLMVSIAVIMMLLPEQVIARGFGGGGGGGARPNIGGGGGGGARPNLGGGGGGGARPNPGNLPNHSPSFSHPTGGGSSRPGIGDGNRPNFNDGNRPSTLPNNNRPAIGSGGTPGAGNRPNIGGDNRPSTLPAGNRPNLGEGNRPNFPGGGTGIGNNTKIGDFSNKANNSNWGNKTNVGQIGNNNFNNFNNVHNNINIASSRPYYNNWQHGNWNGNWNRPGGNGYWSGYAHGYSHGYYNGGWGGYWHGGYGGYWGRPWYAAPIAWGLGAWAVGSIIYSSGYSSYSNPYYASGGSSAPYYDYSQPITVINQQGSDPSASATPGADPANPAPLPPAVQEGTSHMDLAREAFKNGNYPTASQEVDLAIKSLPKDAALHEFRALVFFAQKDYRQAAATLYAVLSAGPGWDWTTLSGMYANALTYSEQLRELEQFVKSNPASPDARFVLAYHYLTCGYNDAAIKQYQEVIKLQPGNQLAAQLLKMLGDAPPAAGQAVPPAPADAPATSPAAAENEPVPPAAIDATKIVGQWTAKRTNGPTFSLKLTSDSKFTWGYDQGGKREEFGGKYSVDGAILVLERSDGAQMPGLVTLADTGFNFKLYGGPPDDSGLDFKK